MSECDEYDRRLRGKKVRFAAIEGIAENCKTSFPDPRMMTVQLITESPVFLNLNTVFPKKSK